jgi:ATP-dependent HslUV protease ATP-binding subunit HslU
VTRDDYKRILTEPEASLIKQYVALMGTEHVTAAPHSARSPEAALLLPDLDRAPGPAAGTALVGDGAARRMAP